MLWARNSEEATWGLYERISGFTVNRNSPKRTLCERPWLSPPPLSFSASIGSLFCGTTAFSTGKDDVSAELIQSNVIWIEHPLDSSELSRLLCFSLEYIC